MEKKKKKLRIGLLAEGNTVPAWTYRMLEKIIESDHSEIVLVVKKSKSKENQKRLTRRIWENRKRLLWILHGKIENRFFRITPNAFSSKKIDGLLNCDELNVSPRETKFSDYVLESDLNKIEKYKVDVFIRLGFRILRGGILKASKYGIWSYHHGDNRINRGSPAGAWEVLNKWDDTGVILQILSENLDGGTILANSFSATDKVSVNKNRNNLYWKALSLLPRKLKNLHELGEEVFFKELKIRNKNIEFYSNRLFITPTNSEVLKKVSSLYLRKIFEKIDRLFYFNQWILLFKINKQRKWSTSFFRFKRMVPPKDRFWADPFVLEKEGRYYIFIEELIFEERKGKISVIEMDDKGDYGVPKTVLEKDYHLSYPFIFEDKNDLFMIPETAQNRTIELYKCIEFPFKWELVNILMDGLYAVDSTVLKHENKYWLFCNIKENEGASSSDELFLFYSEDLFGNNWTSHPKNPIISDIKQSRPAGRIFEDSGSLFRPSQNSAKRYGYGIKINKIIELSSTDYKELTIQDISPNWSKDLLSTHTINNVGKLTIIDALIKRRK